MDSWDRDDDVAGSSDESGKDWNKTKISLLTEGYREGKAEALDEEIENYFEIAQSIFFKNSFRLGQLKGIILCQASEIKEGEIASALKQILNDLSEELIIIKQIRLPPDGNFDEFVKVESEKMDTRFECLKERLLTADPRSQVYIDSQKVGKWWPEIKPALPSDK